MKKKSVLIIQILYFNKCDCKRETNTVMPVEELEKNMGILMTEDINACIKKIEEAHKKKGRGGEIAQLNAPPEFRG